MPTFAAVAVRKRRLKLQPEQFEIDGARKCFQLIAESAQTSQPIIKVEETRPINTLSPQR